MYELREAGLFLRDLTVEPRNNNYVLLNGIQPEPTSFGWVKYHYLNFPVIGTCKVRLTRHIFWKRRRSIYERVYEITLQDGKVVKEEKWGSNLPNGSSWFPDQQKRELLLEALGIRPDDSG